MGSKRRMSLPATGRDSVAVWNVHRRRAGAKADDGAGDGNRGGLQLIPLQFGPRKDDPAFEFLVNFTRSLVKNVVNEDVLVLSMYSAQHATGATKEQVSAFKTLVLDYWAKNKIWPEGF